MGGTEWSEGAFGAGSNRIIQSMRGRGDGVVGAVMVGLVGGLGVGVEARRGREGTCKNLKEG